MKERIEMNSRNKRKPASRLGAEMEAAFGPAQTCAPATGLNSVAPQTEDDYRREKQDSEDRVTAQVGASINVLQPSLVALVDQLQGLVYAAMVAKGFWGYDQDNFGLKTALVHSEVSEMLEANRKSIGADDKIPEFTGEEAEAADAIIRLLDMSGRYNWHLGEAIVAKMLFNLTRPHKHGKAY